MVTFKRAEVNGLDFKVILIIIPLMKTKILEQIKSIITQLESLNIHNDKEDYYRLNKILTHYKAMKQVLQDEQVNINRVESILNDKQHEVDILLQKYS